MSKNKTPAPPHFHVFSDMCYFDSIAFATQRYLSKDLSRGASALVSALGVHAVVACLCRWRRKPTKHEIYECIETKSFPARHDRLLP